MDYYLSIIFAIVFAIMCAYMAKRKARSVPVWFIAGLLVTVFALIILFFLPSLDDKVNKEEVISDLKKVQKFKEANQITNNELPNKLWYYLDEQNQQQGPISMQYLMDEFKNGRIKSNTFVWNEELIDWKPLEETSDFQLLQDKKN